MTEVTDSVPNQDEPSEIDKKKINPFIEEEKHVDEA